MQLAPGLHGISGISANGGLTHLHEVRTWRQFPNILVENVLSQMKWQLRGANNALGNAGQPPLRLKSNIFPVPATRGPHESRRKQKQGYAASAAQMRLAQMRSAVLRAPFLDWLGAPWGFCWVRVSHSPCHTSHPPKIHRLVSKTLLRASAFCTNINILYLPRQPAVKNSFSSKFCFDSLLLSLSYWKLDVTHTLLGFSSRSTFINIL